MFKSPWAQGIALFSALAAAAWLVAARAAFPPVILSAAFFVGAVFYLTYTRKSALLLPIALLSATTLLTGYLYYIYADSYQSRVALAVIPFVLLLIGQIMVHLSKHRVNSGRHFAAVFKVMGVVAVAFSLLAASFTFFHYGFAEIRQQGVIAMGPLWLLYLASVVVGVQGVGVENERFSIILKDNSSWLLLDALAFFLLLLPLTQQGLMILTNIFIFVWAVSLIRLGRRVKDKVYLYTGPLVIMLALVSLFYKLI
ncbi:hypothetical protein [Desulfofalx alkaliphila]|uniref:hypothetical protein n=1 Tax=Desulfofalx alkaliphila TaxID=105483 RepID=UPI0004E23D00|nr:hypothetical protein [Desulfofalx alkaliphila]